MWNGRQIVTQNVAQVQKTKLETLFANNVRKGVSCLRLCDYLDRYVCCIVRPKQIEIARAAAICVRWNVTHRLKWWISFYGCNRKNGSPKTTKWQSAHSAHRIQWAMNEWMGDLVLYHGCGARCHAHTPFHCFIYHFFVSLSFRQITIIMLRVTRVMSDCLASVVSPFSMKWNEQAYKRQMETATRCSAYVCFHLLLYSIWLSDNLQYFFFSLSLVVHGLHHTLHTHTRAQME